MATVFTALLFADSSPAVAPSTGSPRTSARESRQSALKRCRQCRACRHATSEVAHMRAQSPQRAMMVCIYVLEKKTWRAQRA